MATSRAPLVECLSSRSITHAFIFHWKSLLLEGFLPEALLVEAFLSSGRCCSRRSSSYKTDLVRVLRLDRDEKVSSIYCIKMR